MKPFLLVLYLLGSGMYQERFATSEDCKDAMIEANIVKGIDLWSAVCVSPDEEVYVQLGVGP
jgi:hypothetical protein